MIEREVECLVDIERLDIERLSRDVERVLQKDLPSQWRGVHLYMGKIRAEIGGVLDACKESVDSNTNLLFDGCSDVLALSGDNKAYRDYPEDVNASPAYVVMWLWCRCTHPITGGIKYYWAVSRHTYLYRVSRRIREYLGKWLKVWKVAIRERVINEDVSLSVLVWYIKMVYLYTALKNERERIKEQAYIEGVALPVVDEAAPVLPPVAVAAPAAVTSPSPRRNAASKEKDGILTARARKYLEKAIEAGMMVKDGGCYRWKYNGGSNISLAYFLKRIYNDDGCGATPFKKLEELFGVRNLAQSTNSLLNSRNEPKWQARLDELFDDD